MNLIGWLEKETSIKMNFKLLQSIIKYRIKMSGFSMTEKEVLDSIDTNAEGKEKLLTMWEDLHNEDGFPPKELAEDDYFYMLLEKDIITSPQYDQLRTML